MTGTNSDGTLYTLSGSIATTNCKDFTDLTDPGGFGGTDRYGGAFGWLDDNYWSCMGATQVTVICMGNTRVATVAPIVTAGKKIWVSNTPFVVGGTQTPNALCMATRPAGVTGAAAHAGDHDHERRFGAQHDRQLRASRRNLRCHRGRAGQLRAAPRSLTASRSASGIWQSGDGVYRQFPPSGALVWTGQTSVAAVGTAATTCNNWTDSRRTAWP